MNCLKSYSPQSDVSVEANLARQGDVLTLEYLLKDPRHVVQDSLRTGHWKNWERADELWKTTCFEGFFAIAGQPGYWELNLSPSKQKWNLYSFDAYRSPQPPRISNDFELIEVACGTDTLKCVLKMNTAAPKLEVNLTTVIRTMQGVSYFALQHSKQKPDFHDRSCFVLKI